MAAPTMMSCQPQKWILDSKSLAMRALQRPLGRVVDAREHHVADEGEDRPRSCAAEGEFLIEEDFDGILARGGEFDSPEHGDIGGLQFLIIEVKGGVGAGQNFFIRA
jgi:hypothetical protein